jgi:hypothetical protein
MLGGLVVGCFVVVYQQVMVYRYHHRQQLSAQLYQPIPPSDYLSRCSTAHSGTGASVNEVSRTHFPDVPCALSGASRKAGSLKNWPPEEITPSPPAYEPVLQNSTGPARRRSPRAEFLPAPPIIYAALSAVPILSLSFVAAPCVRCRKWRTVVGL